MICEIINFIPGGENIDITLTKSEQYLELQIQNTGLDLSHNEEVNHNSLLNFSVSHLPAGTIFSYKFFKKEIEALKEDATGIQLTVSKGLPEFYSEVRKRLRSHFTKAENLVSFLQIHHPKDALFLQKVHALIEKNMENELFDSSSLAIALHMSRTQLFRRLKPIIQQAPATYIKSVRLQKAKTLLETTNLTVGEVCYQTGFQSQSHFSKIFTTKYGLCPSLFRRDKMEQSDKSLQQSD